jgi:hypothetical protein
MVPAEYAAFCEQVFSDWVAGNLHIAAPIQNTFLMEYCPEPYLIFREGQRTLTFLTKNSGGGMDHQLRKNVRAGNPGIIDPKRPYIENARLLADWYEQFLGERREDNKDTLRSEKGAATRIRKMKEIKDKAGYSGMIQLEVFPFHSKSQDVNHGLLQNALNDPLVSQFFEVTKKALKGLDVIAISGTGPNPNKSPYINFVADLMGLDLKSASAEVLVRNKNGPTGWLFYSRRDGYFRGIYAVRGNNNLPAEAGFQRIAKILCP